MICFLLPPPPHHFSFLIRACLFAFLWSAGWLTPGFAQSVSTSWAIEVSPTPPPCGAVIPTGCSDEGSCSTVYYYVSLVPIGGDCSSEKPFRFSSLQFAGKLGGTAGTTTTRLLSHLDSPASLACSPPEVNSGGITTASWDPTGIFSYVTNTAGSGVSEITWQVTRHLLFVIAVNVYPGETVIPINMEGSFTLVSGTAPNTSTTAYTSTIISVGDLNKTISLPSDCVNVPFLKFGATEAANLPDFPQSKRVGVYVNAGSSTVQQLDFLVDIKTSAMGAINILPGQLPATAFTLYPENEALPDNQRLYVSAQNLSLPTGETLLFYITFDGPIAASGCASADLSFIGPRRVKALKNGVPFCCQPLLTSGRSIDLGPTPCTFYCSPNTQLQVKNVTAFPSGSNVCSDLYFALNIANKASPGSPGISYTSGKVVLDIKYNGTSLSLSSFDPEAGITATSSSVSTSTGLRVTVNYAGTINVAAGASQQLGIFHLSGSSECIQSIQLYDATMDQGSCVVKSFKTDIGDKLDDDLCTKNFSISFHTQYPTQQAIQDVMYQITKAGCATIQGMSSSSGTDASCLCNVPGEQTVTPTKNINPLNGVTTYDLVFISKHILGIQPLGNPYKIVAGDANKSRSLTALDIVELRKLILGIYQTLPNNNTSWRFIDKDFVFPDPLNPFQTVFPEAKNFTPSTSNELKFYGVKVGDVSGDANGGSLEATATDRGVSPLALGYALPASHRDESLEIPLFAQQSAEVVAWQLALNYDPTQWRVKGVRWPASLSDRPHQQAAWHEPVSGEIRLTWFDGDGMATALQDQSPLAYLQVERLVSEAETAFQLASTLPAEAYGVDGHILACQLSAVAQYQPPALPVAERATKSDAPAWTASLYPNPAGQQFRVNIQLPISGEGVLTFSDLLGREIARHQCSLVAGENTITSAQLPALAAGLYFVRIDTPAGRQTLRLVKR